MSGLLFTTAVIREDAVWMTGPEGPNRQLPPQHRITTDGEMMAIPPAALGWLLNQPIRAARAFARQDKKRDLFTLHVRGRTYWLRSPDVDEPRGDGIEFTVVREELHPDDLSRCTACGALTMLDDEAIHVGFHMQLAAGQPGNVPNDPLQADDTDRALYRERAHLVAFLAACYPSLIAYNDPDEPNWPVVYVDSPAGQLSWHINPDDLDLFRHVTCNTVHYLRGQWDGHDTEEKYRRLDQVTRRLVCMF